MVIVVIVVQDVMIDQIMVINVIEHHVVDLEVDLEDVVVVNMIDIVIIQIVNQDQDQDHVVIDIRIINVHHHRVEIDHVHP